MTTSSPRFNTARSADIIPSVVPQVTVTSLSGSQLKWLKRFTFLEMARRSSGDPRVIEYWLKPFLIALMADCFTSAGGSKSGKPWARLIALLAWQSLVISRITDSVKPSALLAGPLMKEAFDRRAK